jgi:hypothetical protein
LIIGVIDFERLCDGPDTRENSIKFYDIGTGADGCILAVNEGILIAGRKNKTADKNINAMSQYFYNPPFCL